MQNKKVVDAFGKFILYLFIALGLSILVVYLWDKFM